ncbi:hypothetical protein D6D01_04267 [Aureobasidium pullulans]|uniref:Zn(2)-C6 fungal-type domain-containing protein n=1 Tax=Aureobasidium pullulans TaxID=5580 RepID=A0A4S9LDQ1_AURPU|nr:hypothetical protein D6D01_04267 [Aureobasidium pullulans]
MATVRRKACERCWRRKQKCDRLLPTCTNCAEANAACASRNLTYAPAPDHAGLAIERGESYISSLKRKVDHLQNLQASKEARLESHNVHRESIAEGSMPEEDNNEPATASRTDQMETQHSRETLDEFGSLVLTAMAEPGDHDIISALSTSAFLRAETGGFSRSNDPVKDFLEQSRSEIVFPHDATAYFLAKFRAEFDGRYGLDYDELVDDHNLVVLRHNDREAVEGEMIFSFAFVYLAVAIGILVTPGARHQQSLAAKLHHVATQLMTKDDLDRSPLTGLRCLLALTVYALYSGHGGCPWRLVNMAAQQAVLLGIHRGSIGEGVPSVTAASRRLFISLYLLERSVASSMHRPFALQDEDISAFWHTNDHHNGRFRPERLHLVDQAQLISSMQGELLFQFSSFRHWEETLPLNFGHVEFYSDGSVDANGHLLQLSCRTLVRISLSDIRGVRHCRLHMFENEESLEELTLSRSRTFACLLRKRLDEGTLVPCKLDFYDLLSACVVCCSTVEEPKCTDRQNLVELLRLTLGLFNAFAQAFEEAKVFAKALEMTISLKFTDSNVIGIGRAEDALVLSMIDTLGKVPRFVRNTLHDLRVSDIRRNSAEPPQSTQVTSEHNSGKPTVYFIDDYHPEAVKHCNTLFNVIGPKDPEAKNGRQNARYILVKGSQVTAEDVAQAKKLRAIGKQGVGIDKIDATACKAAGIKIFNTPGVNATAVAELVLALTMSVAREIRPITLRQGAGEAVPKATCSGLILTGRSIGLPGMGNISRRVAEISRGAFGSHIIAYDPYLPEDAWSDLPHERATTIDEVLAADIVSIHVPLVKETTNLISYAQLERMQPTSILINAARGGIVNEPDLARALHEGLIWGAGLDCYVQEPPTKEMYAKLWSSSKVVSTPHIGAATDQTQMETAKAAVDRLFEFAKQQ